MSARAGLMPGTPPRSAAGSAASARPARRARRARSRSPGRRTTAARRARCAAGGEVADGAADARRGARRAPAPQPGGAPRARRATCVAQRLDCLALAGSSPGRKRSVMRTAPSRQEPSSLRRAALDARRAAAAAAEVEHGAVAQRRRVDRGEVAVARLLLAREHPDLEARALRAARGTPRGCRVADRAGRDRVARPSSPVARQKWAKTRASRARAPSRSSPSAPVSSIARADAHRLVDLVGALPPAASRRLGGVTRRRPGGTSWSRGRRRRAASPRVVARPRRPQPVGRSMSSIR